ANSSHTVAADGTAAADSVTPSLHDALPISDRADANRAQRAVSGKRRADRFLSGVVRCARRAGVWFPDAGAAHDPPARLRPAARKDRKSTRLNSSHVKISYAVFCLKTKTTAR